LATDVVQAVITALNAAFNAAGAGGGAGPFSGLPANPVPTSDAQGMMSAFLDTLLSRKAGKALSISSDYTITDSDGVVELLVTTGTGTINITLPASATNQARDIKITKADTGAGGINIVPAGSDAIMRGASTLAFGSPTYPQAQDASISFSCRGSNWAEHNGPIIGTNSNGTYIKWGNGLMVQHGWTYGSTSATTQAFDITVTLPSTMNGTEFDIFSSFLGYKSISSGVPASRVDISGSIGAEHTAGARPLTSSTASLRVSSAGSGSNINTTLYYMISWASIGMWK